MSTDQQPGTPSKPVPAVSPEPAGYVPAFNGADGQEDPAPEPVVSSTAMPRAAQPASSAPPDSILGKVAAAALPAEEDGRFEIAEEVSTDLQSDQARRVGQMPQAVDAAAAAAIPDPAAAIIDTVTEKNPPATPAGTERSKDR